MLRRAREKRQARKVLKSFALILVLALPLLCYVGFQVQEQSLRKATDEIRQETLHLRESNQKLHMEKTRLESLNRIESEAQTRLNMHEAAQGQIISVYTRKQGEIRLADKETGTP